MIRENRCEYLTFISILYSSSSLSNIANFFGTPSKFVETFEEQVVGLKHPVRSEQNGLERAPSEIRGFHRWKDSVKDGKTKFSQGGCLMMRGKSCVTFTLDNFHLIEPAYHSNGTVSLTRR